MKKIPQELKKIIGSQQVDFVIKSKKDKPLKIVLKGFLFSTGWLLFVFMMAYFVIPSVFEFSNSNYFQTIIENFFNVGFVFPLVILLFFLIGISLLIYDFIKLFQKGSYFVGTENGLIKYNNRKTKKIVWEQFTGNIKIESNSRSGNLELEMKSEQVKSNEDGKVYIPYPIYIVEIDNIYDIERKCRVRIQEKTTNR